MNPKSELMHLTERIKPAHPQQNGRHAASRRSGDGNNLARGFVEAKTSAENVMEQTKRTRRKRKAA